MLPSPSSDLLSAGSEEVDTRDLLRHFIDLFADEAVRGVDEHGVPNFRPYQFEACHALFESILLQTCDKFTWLFARQMGKTEAVVIAVGAAVFYVYLLGHFPQPPGHGIPYGASLRKNFPKGIQAGFFGPRLKTADVDYLRLQRILGKIHSRFAVAGLSRPVSNTERDNAWAPDPASGELRQVWEIRSVSAAPASDIEGLTFNVIVTEESQDIDREKQYIEIDPMGGASLCSYCRIGTVGDRYTWFDEEIEMHKSRFPHRHFEFDYSVGVAQNFRNGAYKIFCDKLVAEKGFDSEEFLRKYRLVRSFEKGMLVSNDGFLKLAEIHEPRWDREPAELPPNVLIVAGLDVAKSADFTVLKIGSADWNGVRTWIEEETPVPKSLIRWQKTYDHANYDLQWIEIQRDLQNFPGLKKFGVIAVDATGDRGNMSERLVAAGYNVIPVVFTGGVKGTEYDKDGTILPGSKSSLCIKYTEALDCGQFGYAADERWMGTLDFYRLQGRPVPPTAVVYPPDPEYTRHKAELTRCVRDWKGNNRLDLHAETGNEHAHDDQVDADMLFQFAAIYYRMIDLSRAKTLGAPRTMSALAPESMRTMLSSVREFFS